MTGESQEGSPPSRPPDDGELRLGATERGTAANGVILALTRAARSFLLYDPSNEAIRIFLQALRETTDGFLEKHGDLKLAVRPFELLVDGEVVYLDRDRERSLAFRLFRDGVRGLVVERGLEWTELLKLLEVLSIRYTGVRQTEDDMVVLLWKAGFQHIQIEAVEGFVPEDEVGDAGAAVPSGGGTHVEAPPDFDLPPPPLKVPGPVVYRPVSAADRARILEEDATQALPELCLRLVDQLLAVAADPTDPLGFDEVVPQLREIRDFLLAEGLLDTVRAFVTLLLRARLPPEAGKDRDALLATFADERAMARLVRSVPRDEKTAPPEMVALLDQLPGDHLVTLVAVLQKEHDQTSRRMVRSLIERYVPSRAPALVERLVNADTHLACELLRTLSYADPVKALDGVQALQGRTDVEILIECLHVVQKAPTTPATARFLVGWAGSPNEEIRLRALELIAKRNLEGAFAPLIERLRKEAPLRLSPREAEALGETLARIAPPKALDAFREFVKPRGFFSGVLPGTAMLQWAAVSGLAILPGDEPETLIKVASAKGGSDLQRHCTAAMVRRRRMARGAQA